MILTMLFEEEFAEKWKKENGETPSHALYKLREKSFIREEQKIKYEPLNGADAELEKILKEKEKEYYQERNLYIIDRVFHEVGYEEMLAVAESFCAEIVKKKVLEYVPCESADKQCRFDCWKFEHCMLKSGRLTED